MELARQNKWRKKMLVGWYERKVRKMRKHLERNPHDNQIREKLDTYENSLRGARCTNRQKEV